MPVSNLNFGKVQVHHYQEEQASSKEIGLQKIKWRFGQEIEGRDKIAYKYETHGEEDKFTRFPHEMSRRKSEDRQEHTVMMLPRDRRSDGQA